jgi:Fur family ferric uptake transcriptional regulator
MPEHEAILSLIQQAGHRLTPQRVMVVDAIGDLGDHVTVERIHEHVLESYPYMDLATVYRTVGLLKRLHVLNEVMRGSVSHYELADPAHRHHHMVCEHCGSAIHLPTKYLDALQAQLMHDTGFEPHMEHFTISGLCADCRKDTGHSHNGRPHSHSDANGHAHASTAQ